MACNVMEGNVPLQCKPFNTDFAIHLTLLIKFCFSLSCFGETRSPVVCGGPGLSSELRQISVSFVLMESSPRWDA